LLVLLILQGPIIGILHQYAHYGEGTTIHSVPQLLHFGIDVDEMAIKSSMGSSRAWCGGLTPWGGWHSSVNACGGSM